MRKTLAATLGAGLMLLTACSGGGTPGLTITGKVVYPTGEAGAFLPLMIGSKVTSTNAGGNFSAYQVGRDHRAGLVLDRGQPLGEPPQHRKLYRQILR